MKDFLKDWGIPLFILLIIVPVYLYYNNPSFSSDVDKALEQPPYLSTRNDTLFIDDFKFSIGISGFNQVEGDFDALNEKVYKLLKGSSGDYTVVLRRSKEDKYGNQTTEYDSFGVLKTDELNKFQSVKYWKESGGMRDIILNNTDQVTFADTEAPSSNTNTGSLKVVSTNCSHSDCNDLVGKILDVQEEENQLLINFGEEIARFPKISENKYGYETTRESENPTYRYQFLVEIERDAGRIITLNHTVNVTYDNGVTEVRAFSAQK